MKADKIDIIDLEITREKIISLFIRIFYCNMENINKNKIIIIIIFLIIIFFPKISLGYELHSE